MSCSISDQVAQHSTSTTPDKTLRRSLQHRRWRFNSPVSCLGHSLPSPVYPPAIERLYLSHASRRITASAASRTADLHSACIAPHGTRPTSTPTEIPLSASARRQLSFIHRSPNSNKQWLTLRATSQPTVAVQDSGRQQSHYTSTTPTMPDRECWSSMRRRTERPDRARSGVHMAGHRTAPVGSHQQQLQRDRCTASPQHQHHTISAVSPDRKCTAILMPSSCSLYCPPHP